MAGTAGKPGDPRRAPTARSARTPATPKRPAPEPAAVEPRVAKELVTGDLLAARYRLLEQLPAGSAAALWRAHDEVLARAVAVKVVPTPNRVARAEAQAFLDAAVRCGAVNHPGVARVYDAALEPRPGRGNDVAYVVSEWVEGEPLDAHLGRVGALAAVDAADVLRQAADALTAAHASGLAHGRVHPRNVLVAESGRVRLTDLAVAAALHGSPAEPAGDTRDLAAVAYALVTRRWPAAATPQPGGSLTDAPVEGGQLLTPRQLRAGVPREVDSAVVRALQPQRLASHAPLLTPAALADAADAAVAGERAELAAVEEERAEPGPPGRLRRAAPWLAAAAFVTAVGVAGWTIGLAVGDLPRRPDAVDQIVAASEAPTPGVAQHPVIPLTGVTAADFDPLGKDKQENPDQVQNVLDADTSTAWSTSVYRTPDFSGLKPGVGLVLDFGRKRTFHTAQVLFSAAGASLELRAADTRPTTLDQTRVIASDTSGKKLVTLKPPATTTQFLVLWITALPKDDKGYRDGISALRFT